ncbi:hypothetical protein C0991_011529 [Blastosporella zonata]|nr:hypothetical protein C0991_011529 [Blastosporella zonata]
MDRYFKMERAREEIQRLNIEIKRVVTHMRDEEAFLLRKEREVACTNKALAYQVYLYREERTQFYDAHRRRFKQLASNAKFSGSIIPGVPIDNTLVSGVDADQEELHQMVGIEEQRKEEEEEEEEEEDREAEEEEEEAEDGGVGLLAEALEAFTVAAH